MNSYTGPRSSVYLCASQSDLDAGITSLDKMVKDHLESLAIMYGSPLTLDKVDVVDDGIRYLTILPGHPREQKQILHQWRMSVKEPA